ncbi:MAG: flagellar FlbD family protein [Acidimicrobiales bacterium]
MIVVHNVHGEPLAINSELIERVEGDNETHVTLVNGVRYIVGETLEEVVHLCREDRAEVRSMAERLLALPVPPPAPGPPEVALHLVEKQAVPAESEEPR